MTRVSYVRFLFLICLVLPMAALYSCDADSHHDANQKSNTFIVPVTTWVRAYIAFSDAGGYAPHGRLEMPILWLYNPQGQPIKFFMQTDSEKVRGTLEHFPSSVSRAKALQYEPKLNVMYALITSYRKILRVAANSKQNPKNAYAHLRKLLNSSGSAELMPKNAAYTAVLLYRTGECKFCAQFKHWLQNAERRAPNKLSTITIVLNRNGG